MHTISKPSKENDYLGEHAELIMSSLQRLTGRDLIDPKLPKKDRYRLLYEAPFCVLSHNAETDPTFSYANKKGLELFEMDWDDFIKLPSRLSAEPQVREERKRLLARVTKYGFIDDYRGVRVSSTGKRFLVEHAIVWNLMAEDGTYHGQAAVLYEWTELSPDAA